MHLFPKNVVVAVLGSGSRGNCTYIGDGVHGVLIDCGISTRQVMDRMAAVDLAGAPIDAVLITHEHSDHVGAAAVLDRRISSDAGNCVPFHMTAGTRRRLNPRVTPRNVTIARAGQAFAVGGLRVEPIAIPHDTDEPVAYLVEAGGVQVGVITDLGHPTTTVTRAFARLDVAVIEFNHDPRMLEDGPYPWQLKQRIRGSHGHLSNEQAAEIVACAGPGLRQMVLAHLSEENNTPEHARIAAEDALAEIGRGDVGVLVGSPYTPLRIDASANDLPAARGARGARQVRAMDATPAAQVSLFGPSAAK